MPPYLLGFKGPAQCIEFEQKPMKVHVVPRSGAAPQVPPPLLLHLYCFRLGIDCDGTVMQLSLGCSSSSRHAAPAELASSTWSN